MSRGYGKIVIDISDLDSAIKEIEKAKQWVNDRSEQLVKELADDGAKVADTIFKGVSSTEQSGSVTIVVDDKPNDSTIKAIGKRAAFIEFGTGVLTSPYPVESTDIPIGMDEWSKRHSQQFHENGYWFFKGHRMSGTGAYRPMANASSTIRRDVRKKAKEVFNQ